MCFVAMLQIHYTVHIYMCHFWYGNKLTYDMAYKTMHAKHVHDKSL